MARLMAPTNDKLYQVYLTLRRLGLTGNGSVVSFQHTSDFDMKLFFAVNGNYEHYRATDAN